MDCILTTQVVILRICMKEAFLLKLLCSETKYISARKEFVIL